MGPCSVPSVRFLTLVSPSFMTFKLLKDSNQPHALYNHGLRPATVSDKVELMLFSQGC